MGAMSAAEAFASASALYVDEARQAAPIDVRAWGMVVDAQRALFSNGHLAVSMVCLLQCAAIAYFIAYRLPRKSASGLRGKVLMYCAATGVFSAVYAFTGHTWASNLLAIWHNHAEVQLLAVALASRRTWPRYRKWSLVYSAVYAVVSLLVTVKNSRRVWTMVGIVWDGMLPVAFAARYFRSGRDPVWVPGFWAAVLHLVSITVLLTMVDGFAQWFALLLPPTFAALALFVIRWERLSVTRLAGLGQLTADRHGDPPAPSTTTATATRAGNNSKGATRTQRATGSGSGDTSGSAVTAGNSSASGQADGTNVSRDIDASALPDHMFVYLWVGIVVVIGLPMSGILYGPRLMGNVMKALAPLLPAGAIEV